jgi:hypothetical protein
VLSVRRPCRRGICARACDKRPCPRGSRTCDPASCHPDMLVPRLTRSGWRCHRVHHQTAVGRHARGFYRAQVGQVRRLHHVRLRRAKRCQQTHYQDRSTTCTHPLPFETPATRVTVALSAADSKPPPGLTRKLESESGNNQLARPFARKHWQGRLPARYTGAATQELKMPTRQADSTTTGSTPDQAALRCARSASQPSLPPSLTRPNLFSGD